MKLYKLYLIGLFAALTLGACSSDNDDNSNGGGNSKNENANMITAGVPQEVTRLEFPRIKGGTSTIIVHETEDYGVNYCTEFDVAKKSQRWSCYAVYKSNNCKNWERSKWRNPNGVSWQGKTWYKDPFQTDPAIDNNAQPGISEFSSSSYQDISYFERGHIVASEDRVCNQDVNGQTFYMTNMQPQRHEFNGGIWEKMEEKIRSFLSMTMSTQAAHANDTMYVCKGGTIDKAEQILCYTRNKFIVPKYFFAAVLIKNNSGYKAIGFWFEHKAYPSTEKLSAHIVNINKLEELTGIDFFCNLPDDIENKVESQNITSEVLKGLWKIDDSAKSQHHTKKAVPSSRGNGFLRFVHVLYLYNSLFIL